MGYWDAGGVAAEIEAYDALGWCQCCLNEKLSQEVIDTEPKPLQLDYILGKEMVSPMMK